MMRGRGVLHTLAGFENDYEDGEGVRFNFILSNGTRSTQTDNGYETKFSFMMPKNALYKIRSVTIFQNYNGIGGFHFFDKDGEELWKIGLTW